ncbi:MAG: adenylyltransferase/cytidyltransferase family protein, partial [Bacteroidales bacterium]
MKKVFVSGCFDMLHSGHVAFLNEASKFGEVYVALGSDETIKELKGRDTICSEAERKYMLESLKSVKACFVSKGSGMLDFLQELDEIKPDIFIVNEDGNTPEKADLCRKRGIEYKVLKRIPANNLPSRATTKLQSIDTLPYRIDIAGTWIDQPYVSIHHPGPAIVASLESTYDFIERSGMATSTRQKAKKLWPMGLPFGKPEELAKMLFRYDNPPGKKEISGSQDALGIVMPGINKLYYEKNEYWPSSIESVLDEETITWLENHLYFMTLWPRPVEFNVLANTNLSEPGVKKLAEAAEKCWKAILTKDLRSFSRHFLESFEAQVNLFPNMMNTKIKDVIHSYKNQA